MTKQSIYFLLFLVTAIVVGSCYKDKGNYNYTDINKVILKTNRDTVSVVLPDSLKVDLTLDQTAPSEAGFSFEWVMYLSGGTPLTRRTLDTTRNLRAKITELPGSYYLVVYAKDRKTKVEYQKRIFVSVLSAFSEGWLVVEENNNTCDVSMISPVDTVFRNIYSIANNGQKLPAGTRRIPEIRTYNGDQKVFILSPADMVQANYSDFVKIMNYPDFFWQAPTDVKPQEYFVNSYDEMMLNNGKIYCRSLNAPAGTIKLNLPPDGIYYMAPYEIYSAAAGYVVYDTISQQFMKLNIGSVTLTPFSKPGGTPLFYLNNIGKKLLYTEVNTANQCFAFFKNNNDDSLFAFTYNPSLTDPAVKRYDGLTAPGMINARLFVGSRTLPHLYYAYGNSIYKLDIEAKTAVPIYTFPGGTEIRAMKMYRNLKTSADPNNNKLIAVATLENGQGKIYYFPIAATGNFTNDTYSKVFTGFNRINEITFKSLK